MHIKVVLPAPAVVIYQSLYKTSLLVNLVLIPFNQNVVDVEDSIHLLTCPVLVIQSPLVATRLLATISKVSLGFMGESHLMTWSIMCSKTTVSWFVNSMRHTYGVFQPYRRGLFDEQGSRDQISGRRSDGKDHCTVRISPLSGDSFPCVSVLIDWNRDRLGYSN